jgi:glycosyltransferase involved in cell wall biosynthesis
MQMKAQHWASRERAVLSQNPAQVMLSIVVPALNEEKSIAGIIDQILAIREELRDIGITDLQVIVVDDGSKDKTGQIVGDMEDVQLVTHKTNRGYGAALKSGFRRAEGQLLAFLDADSTYPPKCLVQLCKIALNNRADLVIGSRRSGSESQMPALRRVGNLIWSSLLSTIGNERVRDPASGMRVFWRHCLPQLFPLPDGLNFTPVMSTRALHEGLKVVEVPIPYRERSGQSKLHVVRDGLRFLKTILWTALQYNPARILELAGFCALAASALMGLSLLAARLNGVTELGPWGVFAVFIGLIFVVGGVSIFAQGISFNYLVALQHRNPIRQETLIEKIVGISPERHFAWIGASLAASGAVIGLLSLIFGLKGWPITRLWFWQLGGALLLLTGVQFVLFWMLIRVMGTLNQRQRQVGEDLLGAQASPEIPAQHKTIAGGSVI